MDRGTNSPAAKICTALNRLAGDLPAFGLAVSGGGDSIALMHIAAQWAAGRRLMVATVDHGLRPESAGEAKQVHAAAKALGLGHVTLLWKRESETGNLMANARDARLRLLSGWAQRNELPVIALGHTADDQAETLLMRMIRGSGIDGLAGMAEYRTAFGVDWIRPMLDVRRGDLRDWLTENKIDWIDDPSNENEDFDRIRIRKAMAAFGIEAEALARSAGHIRDAKDALSYYAADAARDAIIRNGTLILPRAPFREAPPEICRRLLVAGCRWINGADYPARRATVIYAMHAVSIGNRTTLDGTLIEPSGDRLYFYREPAAALRAGGSRESVWDNRWRVTGLAPNQHIAALGTARLDNLDWRASGLRRDEAAASPAIWEKNVLIAAPLLRKHQNVKVFPLRGASEFRRLVMMH